MCEIYKHFSHDWSHLCTYSEQDMRELFWSETHGTVECKSTNGYAVGKKMLNVTVAMWKEDLQNGLLSKWELRQDPNFPKWWLEKVLRNILK